ncbi:MAG: SDR family oxidoreductase [Betaproteobacteria bacterium]|nr:SDR family oxidoreductase [Betaproteobacteria bacterium]
MATALIVGASRGIGYELARQYRADEWDVIATARDAAGLARLAALGAQTHKLDATDAGAASMLAERLKSTTLDVAVFCAGIYGTRTQQLEPPADAEFDAVMRTNVLSAMRLAPSAAPALARAKGTLAVISSRMGSIGGRGGTAGWLYRASKAALNSALKDMSLVLGPQGVICVSLHPGWVRTDMGGSSAAIDVATSVSGLRRTLAATTPAMNGSFLNYDGSVILW